MGGDCDDVELWGVRLSIVMEADQLEEVFQEQKPLLCLFNTLKDHRGCCGHRRWWGRDSKEELCDVVLCGDESGLGVKFEHVSACFQLLCG